MAIQVSTDIRTEKAKSYNTVIGGSAVFNLYDLTAGAPANCAASITATLLASGTLPATWLNTPSGGSVTMTGTWEDTSANAAGTADFFRIFDTGGTCHIQGVVTATGGGGDATMANPILAPGQPFEVTSFTLTEGGA